MSRGSPTFTESSRAMSLGIGGCSSRLVAGDSFGDGEVAIGAVRDHGLTRLEMDSPAIDLHGDDIRLERHEVGDPADLGIRLTIRPGRVACITDVVVAAQPLVRAEGLLVHGRQRRLVDVCAWYVPSRREARFVQHPRLLSVGDDTVSMVDHEMARRLTDVDAVVAVCGMAEDPFLLLIKGFHGVPRERDARL